MNFNNSDSYPALFCPYDNAILERNAFYAHSEDEYVCHQCGAIFFISTDYSNALKATINGA